MVDEADGSRSRSHNRHAERALALARQATGRRPVAVERITRDSYSHLTYKVRLPAPPHAVAVQFAKRSPDSVAVSAALLEHLGGELDVPEVLLHLDTADEPALVTTWLDGEALNRVLPHLSPGESAPLAHAVAETAARIWSHGFAVPGRIGAGLAVTPRPAPFADCIEAQLHDQLFHTPGGRALGPAMQQALWSRWHEARPAVSGDVETQTALVHGDLAARNLLVRRSSAGEGWTVSVLDWEFAVSGSSLADIGHLLRPYDFSPVSYRHHLESALGALGALEHDEWRTVAWALDLTALTGPLVHGPGHPDNDAVSILINADTGRHERAQKTSRL